MLGPFAITPLAFNKCSLCSTPKISSPVAESSCSEQLFLLSQDYSSDSSCLGILFFSSPAFSQAVLQQKSLTSNFLSRSSSLFQQRMAIIGDQVGYIIGNKAGPAMFNRPKSRLFDPAHVIKAQSFFDKYGARTIILARFIPIVRTFAPVVAGVGNMHYRTFVRYNIIGGILWGTGLPLLGYFLGQFEIVKNNIEIAVLVVVAISVLPVVIEFINHRRKKSKHSAD
jgi:membrane protein YqaA with SNARE-associated domain